MKLSKLATIATIATLAAVSSVALALKPGETAPDFQGTDSNGKTQSLSQYRGKYIVLEWTNQGCPYTKKHYDSGNMEALQREWTAKGVVWLSVVSSAPGELGYVTPSQENDYMRRMKAAPTATILDPTGVIGRLYDAKTTPGMYIIDPQGKLIYEGAIDDKPTVELADIKTAKNYVSTALEESMAGKPVATPVTRSYGCSVKYGPA